MIKWFKIPEILPSLYINTKITERITERLNSKDAKEDDLNNFINYLIFGRCSEGNFPLKLVLGKNREIFLCCSSCGMIFAEYTPFC